MLYNHSATPEEKLEKNSNVYSSVEMHFNRNIHRIDKIMFIIKRTKLVLNEYQKIFNDYL